MSKVSLQINVKDNFNRNLFIIYLFIILIAKIYNIKVVQIKSATNSEIFRSIFLLRKKIITKLTKKVEKIFVKFWTLYIIIKYTYKNQLDIQIIVPLLECKMRTWGYCHPYLSEFFRGFFSEPVSGELKLGRSLKSLIFFFMNCTYIRCTDYEKSANARPRLRLRCYDIFGGWNVRLPTSAARSID